MLIKNRKIQYKCGNRVRILRLLRSNIELQVVELQVVELQVVELQVVELHVVE
jgi:hypothetical protein